MDPNVMFWLYAYCLMFVVLVFGFRGVKLVKRGDYQGHMRSMLWSCNLLLFFVACYVVKVLVMGREDKSTWSTWQLVTLYIHESLILLMLITGTRARLIAAHFKDRLDGKTQAGDSVLRAQHARWGKAALAFATAAFLTATGVLITLIGTRS